MTNLIIAKYIRISQADIESQKKESESISNQRNLIQNFISSSADLKNCKQYEFVDDGFSGTNFERPSFEQLISKVKKGEINCIIVKDFSRFGRSYIELGDYLDRIFPFLGVRFISINDHYDSSKSKELTSGLDVMMKNVVYDLYSKDLSVKVSTGKRIKMKQGLYIGNHVPYGLKKHDTIKGKLIIDEEAANVVKKIFTYAVNGYKSSEIAHKLNMDHILTPGQYYLAQNPNSKKFRNQSAELSWKAMMVCKILHQEMYYGAVVAHKRERVAPCSKITKPVPKEEQIIIEGKHEAIVSKEVWLQAQKVIRKTKKKAQYKKKNYTLKGKVRCGCCGRVFNYIDKKNKYFECVASKNNPYTKCLTGKIPVNQIETVIWNSLQVIFVNVEKIEKRDKEKKLENKARDTIISKQIVLYQNELKKQKSRLFLLIEELNDDAISKEIFLRQKAEIKNQINTIEKEINMLEIEQQDLATISNFETEILIDNVKKYVKGESLSYEMVQAFIKSVYVFDHKHIEIKWNFSDELMKILVEKQ